MNNFDKDLEVEIEEQTEQLTNDVREYLEKFKITDSSKFEKIVLDLVESANFESFQNILNGRNDRYILELINKID